jgi:hypothetical protein
MHQAVRFKTLPSTHNNPVQIRVKNMGSEIWGRRITPQKHHTQVGSERNMLKKDLGRLGSGPRSGLRAIWITHQVVTSLPSDFAPNAISLSTRNLKWAGLFQSNVGHDLFPSKLLRHHVQVNSAQAAYPLVSACPRDHMGTCPNNFEHLGGRRGRLYFSGRFGGTRSRP